jgi:CheY-like chemotaxis protein
MNDSTKIQDQFTIIVVNEYEVTSRALSAFFESKGFPVQVVTDGEYDKKTYEAISNAYDDGIIPVIHLSEQTKKWSHISSAEMVGDIVKGFTNGGILLTGSIDPDIQYENWLESMPKPLNGWELVEYDILNEIRTDKLEVILTEYLDNKESKSEFKNR